MTRARSGEHLSPTDTGLAVQLSDEAQAELKRLTETQAASAGQTFIVGQSPAEEME
jgi:hypothetical protein